MITLANRTYVLCFEQSYTAAALMEWIEAGKEPEISIRNAKKRSRTKRRFYHKRQRWHLSITYSAHCICHISKNPCKIGGFMKFSNNFNAISV